MFRIPLFRVPAFRVLPQPGTPGHGITEHGTPQNSGRTTIHYPEDQWNTTEQRNHTKRRTIVAFLRGSLKLKI